MEDNIATTGVSFLRVRHLENNEGSLYLNDLGSDDQQYNQHFKIAAYVPYGKVIDLPLTDGVLLSYFRGAVRNLINRNLVEAYILHNNSIVSVVDSPTTISPGENVVLVDTSQGDITLKLPVLSLIGSGNEFVVKKITPDSNFVYLEGQENDKIENDTVAFSMDDPFGALTLRSSDSGWWLTAQYPSGEGGSPGGGGTGDGDGILFKDEYVLISDPTVKQFTLTEEPHPNSEGVYWNGMHLSEGNDYDYTISGRIVTLNTSLPLIIGDTVTFQYAYGGTGGGGTGTGTAGRRDYLFAVKQAVPKTGGILYLMSDGVMTSSVPLVVNRDSTIASAAINVNNADPSQDFNLEVLVNGTVKESLGLSTGSSFISTTSFSSSVAANDQLALRIVRTSGSERSSFDEVRVTLELTEV